MKVTMSPHGLKELQRALTKMCKDKKKRVQREAYDSGLKVQKKAKENLKKSGAWDLGGAGLSGSIECDRVDGGSATEIGPTAPHGPFIEYGTRPHFPPYKGKEAEGLEGWAKRHGFDSVWPICLVIAERGTPERPFLLPAYMAVVDRYFKNLKEIVRN